MELKKLLIHGFKSFADRVELTFEHGITGVVGPNGCGKSNISDAVRWVMGEQSAKSLRGAKMEDVIFNGTEKRRKQAFCEVTLVFDNTDRSLPIEFSEVSVTRRVFRNGEGEYQINSSPCRLKDIIDLFRDTGIGRDGYSIIGQGRIDEILSQKSEDRRQVFEEAAGIMKYKARKLEAERKLDNTTQNLERVEDILGELEERVEPLRKQSDEAREYLALRDELKGLDLNIFLVRTVKYEARIAELRQGMQDADHELARTEGKLTSLTSERDERQLELDRLELDSAEKREEVQRLIRDVEAGEGEAGVLRERIKAATKEKERLLAQMERAQGGGSGIREEIERMSADLETQKGELGALEETLNQRETALEQAEAELAATEEESERAKAEIIRAMNRLSDVNSQQARLNAMKTSLEQQIERLSASTEQGEEGIRELDGHVRSAQEQLEEEQTHLGEVKEKILSLQETVRASGEESQRLTQEIAVCRDRRAQCESRLKILKEMQRDYEGLNNSVKQVLLQSRRVANSGVHGVVADLIRVPEKLERAIDMVLGGALQNVVVDRDEDAKRMIEYLRANRFGRATFLPISSVRGRTLTAQERSVLSMPGCVGLASELISFDPQYQGVIDNLLGRTVVAENLDSGIPIQRAGRYQFRLVTLEGDVMHSGGSMTGGSAQSRVTSLLSRGREIEQTEKLLRELDADLQEKGKRFSEIERARSAQKQERGELYEALRAQEVLCARAEEYLKAAQDERASSATRAEKLRADTERLNTQLAETTMSLENLATRRNDAEQNNGERNAKVKELSQKVFELRARTEEARKQVTEDRVGFAGRRRDYENAIRERDRLENQADDLENLLRDTQSMLDAGEISLADNASALENCLAALEQARAGLEEARGAFGLCEADRTAAMKRVKELSSEIDKLRESMESASDARHRTEMLLQRAEGEFKQIQDRVWEEYELTYAGAEPFRQQEFKLTEAEKRVTQIRGRIRQMGVVNVAAVDEYRQTVQRVEELSGQRDDINVAIADLEKVISELERNMETQFRSQFEAMNNNFKTTFNRLFGGGTAELRLSDPKDALNCGIEIVAQPPGKKLQTLSLLSGGERALTAIAILFAMLEVKPTPFCILDEIEAALDDANIDNFADYLKTYSVKTQFVVITHRKGTMERCEALYGVVMEEKGVSKLVSVALNEAV